MEATDYLDIQQRNFKVNATRTKRIPMPREGYTLLELLVVIIILSILATLAISHYSVFREKSFDKTAESNLKLIAAAEKIYATEINYYYPLNSTATASDLNAALKLSISLSNPAWNYSVQGISGATNFNVQAERTAVDQMRYWCMNSTTENPINNGANPCF